MKYCCGLNWKSSMHIKQTLYHSDSQISYALMFPAVPELTLYPYQPIKVTILPHPHKYLVVEACATKPRITEMTLKLCKMRIYWQTQDLKFRLWSYQKQIHVYFNNPFSKYFSFIQENISIKFISVFITLK